MVTAVSAIGNDQPFARAHGNWTFPSITRSELAEMASVCVDLIDAYGTEETPNNQPLLDDYVQRMNYVRSNVVPNIWGNPPAGVASYQSSLRGVEQALRKTFLIDKPPSKDDHIKAAQALKGLQNSIRAIETRVGQLTARSSTLDQKISVVERAHQAAEQLPTDLETLAETQVELAKLLATGSADRVEISKILTAIQETEVKIKQSGIEAAAVLERCEQAYRATTSQGLASAFAERSDKLSASMWVWVVGLVCALGLGAYLGSHQLSNVMALLKENSGKSPPTVELWINLLLAVLSVAAPVWFAWLSTKQVGQRFRLAEDYGYKSSISKAYEGYRREAALLDPEFQARLFSSALTRLDELPLRLVEANSHGSPWHELLTSDAVQKALGSVPDFADKVKTLAESALEKAKQGTVAATAAASSAAVGPAANESKVA